jgi:hypothetical protein
MLSPLIEGGGIESPGCVPGLDPLALLPMAST